MPYFIDTSIVFTLITTEMCQKILQFTCLFKNPISIQIKKNRQVQKFYFIENKLFSVIKKKKDIETIDIGI